MTRKSLPLFTTGEVRTVAMALALKTAIILSIAVFFYAFSDFENVHNLWNRWYTGQDNLSSWYIPFTNWDGQHYLKLSNYGYSNIQSQSSAFYPLYPALLHLLSKVFPQYVAAILLSYVTTAGFCLYLYRTAVHVGCPCPPMAVLLVLTFPTAFYCSVFYTESLFLFLVMGFIYHLLVTRSNARLVYMVLLPLTRGTAAFIFCSLVLYGILQYGGRRWGRDRRKVAALPAFDWRYHLNGLLALLVGAAAYFRVMALETGNPFSGVQAQQLFASRNSLANLVNPLIFLQNLSFHNLQGWFGFSYSIHDKIFMTLLLGCIIFFILFREWSLLCFYLPIVYMHIGVSENPMSYSRYVLIAIPFLALVLAKHIQRRQPIFSVSTAGQLIETGMRLGRSWLLYVICGANFMGQIYLAYRFSLNLWVG